MAKSVGSLVAGILLAVCARSAQAQDTPPIPSIEVNAPQVAPQPAGRASRADVGLVIAGSATAGFGVVALIVGLEGFLATYNPTGDVGSAVWLSAGIGGSTLGVVLLVLGLISRDSDHARTHTFDDIIRF